MHSGPEIDALTVEMILTITANSSIDKVIFVDEIIPAGTMRTNRAVNSLGGKGFDSSNVLHTLGADTFAVGSLAGENGRILADMLEQRGIPYEAVWSQGETRISYVIVETKHHRQTHITVGSYEVTPHERDALLAACARHLRPGDWAVCGGSLARGLDQDFYSRVTQTAHQAGARVLIDCPNQPLLLALPHKPDIIKINQHEFQQTFGAGEETIAELARRADKVRRTQAVDSLVITRGKEGMLAVTSQGVFVVHTPPQNEVNSAGAGDAVSGCLPWQLSLGQAWPEALRVAAAASAAVVLTDGTAELNREDFEKIYSQVQISTLEIG